MANLPKGRELEGIKLRIMLKNYLKIVVRSLLKNKSYSILNIFGLAVGITCASLIFLWVEDELNYNDAFSNKDNIYKVLTNQDYNGDVYTFDATPGKLAPTIKGEVPGVIHTTRYNNENHLLALGNKSLYKGGVYVDDDFYAMFGLQFIEGNLENVKNDVNSIVITQKTAKQFFTTDKNIVGKTLKFDNENDHVIAGVIKDLPQNVSLKFAWLGSIKAYEKGNESLKYWGNNSTSTMVQLANEANFNSVNAAIKKIIPEKTNNEGRTYGFLFNMNDWHLHWHFENGVQTASKLTNVHLFFIIALIILIIACINFMNLATARSSQRANEIGVRKVLGSKRKYLIFQFFSESFVLTFLAMLLSIIFILILLPQFNLFVNKQLHIGLNNWAHITALIYIVLFCSLLSGFYPALYLSSLKPVNIFKGLKGKQGGAAFIRNGLVITQFTISIALIVCTIIVYSQIKHVKNRDIGYNKSNLVAISLHGDVLKNIDAVKQEMRNTGMIENVGLNSFNVMHGGWNGAGFSWEGKPEKFDPLISFRFIDADFIPTVEMQIIDGHNFYKEPNENSTEIIISSSLAKMIGNDSAIGKMIRRNDETYEVVGVVKDYLYGNMYSTKSDPVIFFNIPNRATLMYARINENTPLDKATAALSGIIKKNSPAFPFEYRFVEDTFNAKFRKEILIERLSKWFAVLAILISCFGLYGLAAYTAEQRNKEIGIRKVLGSNVSGIVNLLSKDFLKLVLVAIVIALPLAWYIMSTWLQGFNYRITIRWWMLFAGASMAIIIALITVSYQAIKAATQNPVKSLRAE